MEVKKYYVNETIRANVWSMTNHLEIQGDYDKREELQKALLKCQDNQNKVDGKTYGMLKEASNQYAEIRNNKNISLGIDPITGLQLSK